MHSPLFPPSIFRCRFFLFLPQLFLFLSSSPSFSFLSSSFALCILSSTLTACDVSDCYGLLIMAVLLLCSPEQLDDCWVQRFERQAQTSLSLFFVFLSLHLSSFLMLFLSPFIPPYSHFLCACMSSCYTKIVKAVGKVTGENAGCWVQSLLL